MSYYQKYLKYKNKYLELKNKNQKGGNPQIIARMQSFKGDFALVIGSSEHQQKYIDFSDLPENSDKMIISIDLHGEGTNNFKLDFNQEATWSLFEPFNGRFSTIIFDYLTDHHIKHDIKFDIILKIKNLLKIGGKFYKYYSYGSFFIPYDIQKDLLTINFNKVHLNIIFEQFNYNIPTKILETLPKIRTFKIYKSIYGYHHNNLIMHEIEFNEVPLMEASIEKLLKTPEDKMMEHNLLLRTLYPYLKSMYTFYNQLSYIYMLQKKYNFNVESHNKCDSYPFKFETEPHLLRDPLYKYDICFITCTKI
jgi:hypothetical protein